MKRNIPGKTFKIRKANNMYDTPQCQNSFSPKLKYDFISLVKPERTFGPSLKKVEKRYSGFKSCKNDYI